MGTLPSYYYEKLTWEEMNTAIEQQRVILLPVGSTEQHGRHLPLDVDNFLARQVAIGTAELIPDDVLVMPNISYGFNTHHMDFPGQITITGKAFIEYCLCVTRSLSYHGFNKIIIVDGHGSNMPFLDIAARQTNIESEGRTLCLALMHTQLAVDVAGEIRESPLGGMGHACEWETSMYMHLGESDVRTHLLEDENGVPPSRFIWNELQRTSPVSMMPWFSTISKSGTVGSATLATAAKGKALFETTTRRLADLALELKARPIYPRHDNHRQKPAAGLGSLLQF